jgi:peptidoglycan/xylan/chitin deacetylase (PgdA/CDA1 family)
LTRQLTDDKRRQAGLLLRLGRNFLWLHACYPFRCVVFASLLACFIVGGQALRASYETTRPIAGLVIAQNPEPGPVDTDPQPSPVQAVSPNDASPPPPPDPVSQFTARGQPLYCGGSQAPDVALTFDDGPGQFTAQTVTELSQAGQHATFFLVGRELARYGQEVDADRSVGVVGNHSWTHPFLARLPPQTVWDELTHTEAAIEAISKAPVHLFRPPYDSDSAALRDEVHSLGLLEVLWNVDSNDSKGANAQQIVDTVTHGLRPGAIVLMHENHPQTQAALPQILDELKKRNLHSVSIPELLAADPPNEAGSPTYCGLGQAVRPAAIKAPAGQ